MTTNTLQFALNENKRIKDLADSIGNLTKMKKMSDLSTLRPEDILVLFQQGKLKEKDTMFWLGVLALNAEEKAKKHEMLATMDELTQVYNRRAFIDNISKELARLRAKHLQIEQLLSEPITLTIMMVDIDHFKHVNDRYGHLAGDMVLRGVAGTLKNQVRETDSVFRFGGEEFVILLPDTPKELGVEAAKRIIKAIENNKFTINKRTGKEVRVTASIGVHSVEGRDIANVRVTDMLIPKVIAKADEALYFAKENGRNQVVLWNKAMKK
ncbi:MAG TPA: GGDEF domain-containing protein [Patescibacteria group bacterium]|nr:GGDEF domain-containing protein [Patescibacteria group bacterium]